MSDIVAATAWTTANNQLGYISADIGRMLNSSKANVNSLIALEEALTNLNTPAPDGYKDTFEYINAEAVAHPDDEGKQRHKETLDKLQSDYISLRNYLRDVNAAIAAIPLPTGD